jgi:translation initiation factor IF-3
MEHMDLGRKILDNFIADSQNDGHIEKQPVLEGRIMSLIIAPK